MSERINAAALRDFSVSLSRAAGLSADDAALLTDSILFAECRGVTSHGLLRLPQYIARLRSGATASNVPMPFTMESGGTARLDAQNGLGQLAGVAGHGGEDASPDHSQQRVGLDGRDLAVIFQMDAVAGVHLHLGENVVLGEQVDVLFVDIGGHAVHGVP